MPSCNPDFKSICSYEEANGRLREAKPFPGANKNDPHAEYRLEATRKRHMNIRLMSERDLTSLYEEAYGAKKAWGGVETTPRSQAEYRANHEQRHIALRLYNTDVVVYREDGAVFYDPYVSNSTNAFVSQCNPSGIETRYEPRAMLVICAPAEASPDWSYEDRAPYYAWKATHRVYRVASKRRVGFKRDAARGATWWPLEGTGYDPWDVSRVDRKLANAALKAERFHDFDLWAMGRLQMTRKSLNYGLKHIHLKDFIQADKTEPRDHEIMDMLRAGHAGWESLARQPWFWPDITQSVGYGSGSHWRRQAYKLLEERIKNDPKYICILHARRLSERVRMAVYGLHGCVKTEVRDFLLGYKSVTGWQRNQEKYKWWVIS